MTSLSTRHFLKPLSSVNARPYMATCLLHLLHLLHLLLHLLQLLPAVRQLTRCEHLPLAEKVVAVAAVMAVVPARYRTLRSAVPSNTHRHPHIQFHLGNNLPVGLVVRLIHCPCNLTRFHHPMRLEATILSPPRYLKTPVVPSVFLPSHSTRLCLRQIFQ